MSIFRVLKQQFIRDLKANWKKSAILGILVVVGLACWIPQIVKGFGPQSSSATAPSSSVATAVVPPPATVAQVPATASPPSHSGDFHWRDAVALLNSHPSVRPADVAEISGDPFRVDHDQFPPPVLFEDDKPFDVNPVAAAASKINEDAASTPESKPPLGLVLKSTVVGARRRAAIINSTLYYEGSDIRAGGETYRITGIASRKVTLSRGEEKFELRIPTPHDDTTAVSPGSSGSANR